MSTLSRFTPNDPYYTLGVSKEDSLKQIKAKYYKLAK